MPRSVLIGLLSVCLTAPVTAADKLPAPRAPDASTPVVNTFSVVGFDRETGDLGVAVASRVLAAGAIVPYVEADVGAVATQAWANSSFGPRGLADLRDGKSPEQIAASFRESDENIERRQFAIVDAGGRVAAFTGEGCNAHAAHATGDGFSVQGNILAGPEVIDAMESAFRSARDSGEGELADWLMAALTAGDESGGDSRGKQAAALVVARKGGGYGGNDRYIDLRVDDDPEPVAKLARLLELHKELFRDAHEDKPRRTTSDGGQAE